jgi:hypothetical protein
MFRSFISGALLLLLLVLSFSCHLEDFNLNKLANPDDIRPVVGAPLAYGTFRVSDIAKSTLLPGDPIPSGGLSLNPIISKIGTSFRSALMDSVYLVTMITNNTLCELEYELSFINGSSGAQLVTFKGDKKIPAGVKDFRIQFLLAPASMDILQNATAIEFNFRLLLPSTGNITYGMVKSNSLTIKIYFYAPADLRKL